MAIRDEDIQRVKVATDVFRLFSEHGELRKLGRRHHGLCPFHEDRVATFSANIEMGRYYCFRCQAKGGDVIAFVQQRDKVDVDTAVRLLAHRANLEIQDRTDEPDV